MGYRLQMSAEIYDWLTGLRGTDPPAAMLAGQALTALATDGEGLGPPLVISLADWPRPEDLPDALDRCYQARLKSTTAMRHRTAEAATLRKDIERQLTELELAAGSELAATHGQVAELRRLRTEAMKAEQKLIAASLDRQTRADAFRTKRDVLKAVYSAVRAEYLIEQAADTEAGEDAGSLGTEAAARLQDITGEMRRELHQQTAAEGLMELRPGAPGESGIRILFGVEPAGTALLIAVLEGRDAVRDHYREAVFLSAEVLWRVRAGQDSEAAAHAFGDAQSFLDEFFPGHADEVSAGAAALVAANRPPPLAEQRTRLGLTQAELARRMGVRQERVSAIERADLGATEVRTVADYVAALGGRLDVIADFGGERILLQNFTATPRAKQQNGEGLP
jgi:hypothetical protein